MTPISTESTVSIACKSEDIFESENERAAKSEIQSTNRQSKSSIIIGKNMSMQIITPYIPTEDFKSETDAVSVPSASDKTPPATGTEEPIINLAVRIDKLSAWAFTTV